MQGGPTFRAGIIGCGRIASTIEDELHRAPGFGLFPYTHAGAYQRHPRTHLVAAADIDESMLNAFGERWDVTSLYTDYREMLDCEQLDIVSIAASSHLHYSMTMEVVKHPVKGILLEKPVAQSLAEADEMIAACRSAGIKVAVNHFRTFDPYYRAAKALLDDGEIGEVRAVIATWGRRGFSFGGSHLFDLLRYMLGAQVDWVFCHFNDDRPPKDPGGDAYVVYKNGVRAHLHVPFTPVASAAVEFIGTEGGILMGAHDFRWWKQKRVGPQVVPCEYPFPGHNDGKSGMYTAVEELIRATETGEDPASNLEDGRMVLEMIVALHLSGQQGAVVRLPVTDTSYVVEAFA